MKIVMGFMVAFILLLVAVSDDLIDRVDDLESNCIHKEVTNDG